MLQRQKGKGKGGGAESNTADSLGVGPLGRHGGEGRQTPAASVHGQYGGVPVPGAHTHLVRYSNTRGTRLKLASCRMMVFSPRLCQGKAVGVRGAGMMPSAQVARRVRALPRCMQARARNSPPTAPHRTTHAGFTPVAVGHSEDGGAVWREFLHDAGKGSLGRKNAQGGTQQKCTGTGSHAVMYHERERCQRLQQPSPVAAPAVRKTSAHERRHP